MNTRSRPEAWSEQCRFRCIISRGCATKVDLAAFRLSDRTGSSQEQKTIILIGIDWLETRDRVLTIMRNVILMRGRVKK